MVFAKSILRFQLGCGSALPAIWALRHGAVVDVQDYVRIEALPDWIT